MRAWSLRTGSVSKPERNRRHLTAAERRTLATPWLILVVSFLFFPADTFLFLCLALAFYPRYSHMFLPFLSLLLSLSLFVLFESLFPNLRAPLLLFPSPRDCFFPQCMHLLHHR